MSNISTKPGSGGSGTPITTIAGDTGTATGSTITIKSGVSANSQGATVSFAASGSTVAFSLSDAPNENIFLGAGSGNATVVGTQNTGIGSQSLGGGPGTLGSLTLGVDNVAVGWGALVSVTEGSQNIGIGAGSLSGIITGNNNIAIGGASVVYSGAESNNIILGEAGGVLGESNVTRIGFQFDNSAIQLQCFIDGIRGKTTINNDAVAVLIDSAGQLGTVSSSARYKNNIKDMGSDTDRLMQLRPVTFSMKDDESQSKRYGLIAEEVAQVFPELVVYDNGKPETVKYHDLAVMLLNEFQKMKRGE